ncbi:MAG: Crp/Fnr family transcriptional regulator [Bacteroidota bacterium]
MQKLLQHISERAFVGSELRARIESDFEAITVAKKEILLSENSRADYLYFIEKGLIQNYYFHDGKKITSWFYLEGQFVTAWSSFYQQSPSFEEIECLEECHLYRISFAAYQKLIADFSAFGNFARLLAEDILSLLDEFYKAWSFLSAKEKYQLVLRYFPEIELHIKLGLVASFMGISQETLSRIRAGK